MIDQDLRSLAPLEHRLDPRHRQLLKERIMHDITTPEESGAHTRGIETDGRHVAGAPLSGPHTTELGSTAPSTTEAMAQAGAHRQPKRRMRLVGGIIAATVAVSGTAAAAVWLGGPDPQQARTVIDKMPNPVAEVYRGQWRPSLHGESVVCFDRYTQQQHRTLDESIGFASDFPLADLLTSERLIAECTSGNDWARSKGGFDPDQATSCVRDGKEPLAVVTLEGMGCNDAGDSVRPIEQGDLDRLNQMRAFEVALLAIPQECPTVDEAEQWARQQEAAYGESLRLEVWPAGDNGCFSPKAYWYWGDGKLLVEQTRTFESADPTTGQPATGSGVTDDGVQTTSPSTSDESPTGTQAVTDPEN